MCKALNYSVCKTIVLESYSLVAAEFYRLVKDGMAKRLEEFEFWI